MTSGHLVVAYDDVYEFLANLSPGMRTARPKNTKQGKKCQCISAETSGSHSKLINLTLILFHGP